LDIIKDLTRDVKDATNKRLEPLIHQLQILDMIGDFYKKNGSGKLLWSCGLGKTLLSIFIVQKLNFKKIIIGVPSKYLQKQFLSEIFKLYPKKENILCVGDNNNNSTTDPKIINKFHKLQAYPTFIISTYHSCHLLTDLSVDFKIGDESHHLTGLENTETLGFKEFHKIKSKKTLFMTATEKIVETKLDKKIFSMDDPELFGQTIDEKSVKWAIDNKKITDYNLLILSNTENDITSIMKSLEIEIKHKELFMSAFMSLKAIEKYDNLTHILICCNETENTEIIKKYVDVILDKNIFKINKNEFYNEAVHSNKKLNIDLDNPANEITKFKNSKYGIISSVYIFGEGFDLPKLMGVVFSENMVSDIRIIQTAMRGTRLDKLNPNKIAYIIIPFMEYNDCGSEKDAFDRVRMIIHKLRNVDETIEQKITVSSISKKLQPEKPDTKYDFDFDFEDNTNALNKIRLRLKHSKALLSGLTEDMDEYNYVKELNKELNISSKEEYAKYASKHKNYIEDPYKYFTNKAIWTNWYDYLGINTDGFIKCKTQLTMLCKELKINTLDKYKTISKTDPRLPLHPADFYQRFSNIEFELGFGRVRKHM
jgi:predicted helicase